jgi:hypothetical protein
MRRMVAEVHRATLTVDGQQAKSAELCEYLGSDRGEHLEVVERIGERHLAELAHRRLGGPQLSAASKQRTMLAAGRPISAAASRESRSRSRSSARPAPPGRSHLRNPHECLAEVVQPRPSLRRPVDPFFGLGQVSCSGAWRVASMSAGCARDG